MRSVSMHTMASTSPAAASSSSGVNGVSSPAPPVTISWPAATRGSRPPSGSCRVTSTRFTGRSVRRCGWPYQISRCAKRAPIVPFATLRGGGRPGGNAGGRQWRAHRPARGRHRASRPDLPPGPVVDPQQRRRRGPRPDRPRPRAPAGPALVQRRSGQVVRAAHREEPGHRPGAGPRPGDGRAARHASRPRGSRAPARGDHRPRRRRSGARTPPSPSSRPSTARCCGCASSKSSATTRWPSSSTSPSTPPASACYRALQALRAAVKLRPTAT